MVRFLFRFDGSKDNDHFIALQRGEGVDHLYAGQSFSIGPGWVPDCADVELAAEGGKLTCVLPLVELEATEAAARISARKYLPEPSDAVVRGFLTYLDRVLSRCSSTADPRLVAFRQLRDALTGQAQIIVRTAGAIRTEPGYVECLGLIDQPQVEKQRERPQPMDSIPLPFQGGRLLTRAEVHSLKRVLRIFDAVVSGREDSAGTFKSWRNIRTKSIDKLALSETTPYPALKDVLSADPNRGVRIDCDQVTRELVEMWRITDQAGIEQERLASAISAFLPIARSLRYHHRMRDIFGKARTLLRGDERSGT